MKTALVLVVAPFGGGPWLAFEGERTARAQQSAGVMLTVSDAVARIQRVYGNAFHVHDRLRAEAFAQIHQPGVEFARAHRMAYAG